MLFPLHISKGHYEYNMDIVLIDKDGAKHYIFVRGFISLWQKQR